MYNTRKPSGINYRLELSGRIMTVTVKLHKDQEEETQITVTYAATEDALVEEKLFF
jgi:hypothetical protein